MTQAPHRTPPSADPSQRRDFWADYQPGFRFTDQPVGTPAFFQVVEEHRYRLEPAIEEIVKFPSWTDRDVLEAGCGIATDGINFARNGARYTGVDFSPTAIGLAQRRFEQEGRDGARLIQAEITSLPADDATQDLVYSNGVIHHLPDTQAAVNEMHRVLRPGGKALIMVYHRSSFNYHVNIMLIRRVLTLALAVPGATRLIASLTGEDPAVLDGHRELLRQHGIGYLTDRQLFLDNNTDGPGNPLSKVYTRGQARELFGEFSDVALRVRFLNLRLYPGGERLATTRLARQLERRVGWHLWIEAIK